MCNSGPVRTAQQVYFFILTNLKNRNKNKQKTNKKKRERNENQNRNKTELNTKPTRILHWALDLYQTRLYNEATSKYTLKRPAHRC